MISMRTQAVGTTIMRYIQAWNRQRHVLYDKSDPTTYTHRSLPLVAPV